MTIDQGDTVRLVTELRADDGTLLPKGTTATVIGYAGERLVLEVEDWDSGERTSVEAAVWDVRRVRGGA